MLTHPHIKIHPIPFSLAVLLSAFCASTNELSDPGPIPPLVTVELPPPALTPPPMPVRTARKINMDTILSKYHTGLKSIINHQLIDHIDQESRTYGFDPELILALISAESSFYNWSESKKGALGMMQIVPATGRAMAKQRKIILKGKKEAFFDPFMNISLGIQYLYSLTQKFPDLSTALTAYNFGPTRVRQWLRTGKKLPEQYATRILVAYALFLSPDHSQTDST